jgi:hypothetical protein
VAQLAEALGNFQVTYPLCLHSVALWSQPLTDWLPRNFLGGKLRPVPSANNSGVLAVPNAKARMKAQHSIPPMGLRDLLGESFTFTCSRTIYLVERGIAIRLSATMFELTAPCSDLLQSLRHHHMLLSMSGECRWSGLAYVAPLPWPPSSQDLAPLNFNLRGLGKDARTFLRCVQPSVNCRKKQTVVGMSAAQPRVPVREACRRTSFRHTIHMISYNWRFMYFHNIQLKLSSMFCPLCILGKQWCSITYDYKMSYISKIKFDTRHV